MRQPQKHAARRHSAHPSPLPAYLGLGIMAIGVMLLVVLHFMHITFINILLILPLCLILGGLVLYVWGAKRESRY